MRVARPFLFALLVVALVRVPAALAQTTPDLEEGMKPYGDFHGGDIDQVSLSSGKLVLNIPLISYPQRGGKIKVGFSLRWQNITPRQTEVYHANTDLYQERLFRDANNGSTGLLYFVDNLGWNISPWGAYSPDQSLHQWMTPDSGTTYRSIDATGLLFTSANTTLQASDGLRYTFSNLNGGSPVKVEDPNGNFVTSTQNGNAITTWTDTIGRSIPTPLGAVSTTDYSHCSGTNTIARASTWTVPGPNGGTATFKFCYANYSYSFQSDVGGQVATAQGTLAMLQSIVLPNLTTWTFHYEPTYAALSQITLPTGGTISYTWTLQDADCQYSQTYNSLQQTTTTKWGWYLAVASRSVNANDGTGPHTWTYSGTPGGQGTLTITDPFGNDSAHVMTGLGGTGSLFETQAKYYQGSSSTGTLLKTVTTDYSWNPTASNPVNPPYSCWNVSSVVPIRVTTMWPNGQTTKLETDYDSGFSVSPYGNFNYGQVVAQREYDYGNGSPGPLLRTTDTSYLFQSNSNYLTANLLGLASQVVTYNGSGSRVAETDLTYDNPSYLQSSGITTQHEAAPGPVRGNLSTVAHWVNTTNSFVTSTSTMFDTGTVPNDTDPLSHPVNRAYSTSFAGAFPTTVTNALNQSASHNYDFNTGLLTSITDLNNLTTSFSYDNMWRLSSITAPDGAVSTITHQESSFPFTTTLNKPINSSQTETTTNVFDGLGRLSQSQLTSDPQGTVYTDTTYDALGQVATVSNPHRTCSSDITSSCGTTTYGYDALGRKTSETYPDGSVLTTAYCGPSTLVTDPTGKWRRSRVDGLGRLVEVDEPNAPGATVNSNGCPGTGEPIWVTTTAMTRSATLPASCRTALTRVHSRTTRSPAF